MFTGIIETFGTIKELIKIGENIDLIVKSSLSAELKIDQSLAHNGVCLTIVEKDDNQYRVTAIKETIDKSSLGFWKVGNKVNLERGLRLNDRLDGHIVQGHVDTRGKITKIEEKDGSFVFHIEYPKEFAALIIPKGSICVDGVSLTVIDPSMDSFQVAIIPFTMEHTVFHTYEVDSQVNLEFDLLGKYFLRRALVNN